MAEEQEDAGGGGGPTYRKRNKPPPPDAWGDEEEEAEAKQPARDAREKAKGDSGDGEATSRATPPTYRARKNAKIGDGGDGDAPESERRRNERSWNVEDLKRCYRIYDSMEKARSKDPMRHLYIGLALQMGGHGPSSKAKLNTFAIEALAAHGDDLRRALEFYRTKERQAQDVALKSDFDDAQQALLDYDELTKERADRVACCVVS
mmetsp:Transcript_38675/g.121149  ORF Transcript_38675/g.121149 Transcript_38675/m.121149 type:complete len:206 (-) Transcript_38675:67-684(-)